MNHMLRKIATQTNSLITGWSKRLVLVLCSNMRCYKRVGVTMFLRKSSFRKSYEGIGNVWDDSCIQAAGGL